MNRRRYRKEMVKINNRALDIQEKNLEQNRKRVNNDIRHTDYLIMRMQLNTKDLKENMKGLYKECVAEVKRTNERKNSNDST